MIWDDGCWNREVFRYQMTEQDWLDLVWTLAYSPPDVGWYFHQ